MFCLDAAGSGNWGSCVADNPACCNDGDCKPCQSCSGGRCTGTAGSDTPHAEAKPDGSYDWNCNGNIEVSPSKVIPDCDTAACKGSSVTMTKDN
jgi:hypothetical protein